MNERVITTKEIKQGALGIEAAQKLYDEIVEALGEPQKHNAGTLPTKIYRAALVKHVLRKHLGLEPLLDYEARKAIAEGLSNPQILKSSNPQ